MEKTEIKGNKKTKLFTLVLSVPTMEKISNIAKQEDMSQSCLVRNLLKEGLNTKYGI